MKPALRMLLTSIQFAVILDFVIMMPLGPQLLRAFNLTPAEFAFVVSCYSFSSAIIGFLAASIMDRFDRRTMALIAFAGFALGTLGCALAPTFATLVIARIVAGAFGGLISPLIFAIIGDLVPPEQRGTATGQVGMAFPLASVLGIPIGLLLSNIWGWHSTFMFITAACVVIWIGLFKWLPPVRGHLNSENVRNQKWYGNMIVIFQQPNHWNSFAFTISLIFAGFLVIPFLSQYSVKNVGFPEAHLPLIYLIGGICTFMTSPIVGKLADRYGKRRMYVVMASLSILPILATTHLPASPEWLLLLVSTTFMITVSGRFVPAMALMTSATKPETRGGFMSVNNSIQSASMAVASFASGLIVLSDASGNLIHYNVVGMIAVGFTLISIWLSGRIKLVS